MRLLNLFFLITCSSLLVLGCSGLTGREPAQLTRLKISKVPHVIFLIHGFRDDGSSFQDLPEILSAKYKDENIRVKLLKYPAVSDSAEALEMSSYDFAKIINAQIINYLIEQNSADINDSLFEYSHPVDLSTQFTVVAHSQGGLVTMNFLNSCLMSINDLKKQVDERCKYQEGIDLLKRIGLESYLVQEGFYNRLDDKKQSNAPFGIKNFISLGTPFWGSGVANTATDKKFLLKGFEKDLPPVQLENLAIGGRTTSLARVWMLDRYAMGREIDWNEQLKWKSRYPKGLKVWNVSGVLGPLIDQDHSSRIDKALLKRTLWPSYYEHDLVVAAPEARIDFLYYLENPIENKAALRGRTNLAELYIPMKQSHMQLFTYPSMAGVRKEDANSHPLVYLIDHIISNSYNTDSNIPLDTATKNRLLADKLSNFTSEVKLITPPGYYRPFKISPEKVKISAENKVFDEIKLPSALAFWAEAQNPYALRLRNNFYQTYYHVGKFNEQNSFYPKRENMEEHFRKFPKGHKLNYEISVLGFKPKKFSVHVMPSYSSYSEVFLVPDLPIEPKLESSGVLTILPVSKNKYLKISFDHNALNVNVISKVGSVENSTLVRHCYVGFVADKNPDDSNRSNYVSTSILDRLKFKFNDLVSKTKKSFSIELQTGEPLEILGRVAGGFLDKKSGLHRPCVEEEHKQSPESCAKSGFDRYLVTSPYIRAIDKVIGVANITSEKGYRWIDVKDVDVPSEYMVISSSYKKIMPRDYCLLDSRDKQYFPYDFYKSVFYIGEIIR